ncbi:MAG: uracil-DNA glycosylase [Candidatus Latescibacteria bacterium]|nr:uracil-DNA glycosylase [Candidatus Latescibacterota bacterium]NIM21763.1 uracil-DNA glycosylase [Candidatus Latescibacterota bacterium]NIM65901.1 uracil-DNA glycosylase [Candidatus Latescibacterota bacterium]NIO02646.1 uracil-DNA glycosylase [Candidatus Latescibacterota bacterium]NIO29627.1 uracil-DNA glycosylase [Candidatus Latescibacterota bacterium]
MQIDLFDAELNQILSTQTYAEFSELLTKYDCQRCTLCYSRSKIVIDRGSSKADILVISERPGDNEDLIGKAFVGRAGELLDKMFAAIDLDSNKHLLITNVVKCKPEVDRSPTKDEVEACFPFLEKQIKLVSPRVVVLLGAVALKWVDPSRTDIKMEEEAGKFFTLSRFPGIQLMVMYNPAFLLRDPRKKVDTWEHLKSLQTYLQQEKLL